MAKAKNETGGIELNIKTVKVRLESLADIMFDKFIDHSKDTRPAEQKLYLTGDNMAVLPSDNIYSFLFKEKPQGCVKMFEGKKSGLYLAVGQGHVFVNPQLIPFLDEKNNPIHFEGFNKGKFYIFYGSPVVKGQKVEVKPRPVLKHPWALEFTMDIVGNDHIDHVKLHNWFARGGILIGLGTYRPRYGRFTVKQWDLQ